STSKRIAQAYVQMGQLSSAILEFETVLQRYPDDPDVQRALKEIESKANNFPREASPDATVVLKRQGEPAAAAKPAGKTLAPEIEDGRRAMYKLFVESKLISAGDFDLCWPVPDLSTPPKAVTDPFIQVLSEKGILHVDKSLKLLSDKSRIAYL